MVRALLALLAASRAAASLVVAATNETFQDKPAAFGPRVPSSGIQGVLVPVAALGALPGETACAPLPQTLTDSLAALPTPWIALVQRGSCAFSTKIRCMQISGAAAVVVGDNIHAAGLISMAASSNTSDIAIPSTFVALWAYQDIKEQATRDISPFLLASSAHPKRMDAAESLNIAGSIDDLQDLHIPTPGPTPDPPADRTASRSPATHSSLPRLSDPTRFCESILLPCIAIALAPDDPEIPFVEVFVVATISLIIPIAIIIALYHFWAAISAHARARARKPTASPSEIASLQLKSFCAQKQSQNDQSTCAICLEDFADAETLRVLAICHHEFHASCIDPWLTNHSRSCPICKREAFISELTPLVSSQPSSPSSSGMASVSESSPSHSLLIHLPFALNPSPPSPTITIET